jgi:hypothetical protein
MNLRELDCEMKNRVALVRGLATESKILVSWVVTLVVLYMNTNVSEEPDTAISTCILRIQAVCPSETFVTIYKNTIQHCILCNGFRDNHKP